MVFLMMLRVKKERDGHAIHHMHALGQLSG